MHKISLTGNTLTLEDIEKICFSKNGHSKVQVSKTALTKISKSRKYVLKEAFSKKAIYGINTGFGALSGKKIPTADLEQLQYNLVRSHCTGVSEYFPDHIVRCILLMRANCLSSGYSGVSLDAIQLMLEFLNHEIYPQIPKRGSVGASGDLAPLAHMALSLIGEGDSKFKGKVLRSNFIMHQIGLMPLKLGPKDGLALINGTSVLTSLAALATIEAKRLIKIADIAGALTVEALKGSKAPFHQFISKLKPHPGQIACAENLLRLLKGSKIMDSHTNCNKVQDPYSLRCMPQVHGSTRQVIKHVEEVVNIEINSVTDNPLVNTDEQYIISGGNFHGQSVSMAMDYLSIGLSEYASISERRVEKLMNPTFSDLPPFLIQNSGLNSGFMIAQVTSAALVSENKILSHPAVVDNVPTSTDKEDHVSMGVGAGLKLHQILENVKNCLAIEILCSAQAINFHRPLKSSPAIEAVHHLIRKSVSFMEQDRVLSKDIKTIVDLIDNGDIINCVEEKIGALK
jgi:histidine ammonia-lyase